MTTDPIPSPADVREIARRAAHDRLCRYLPDRHEPTVLCSLTVPYAAADAVVAALVPLIRQDEQNRQAAYLYSVIQSAENSEDGAAESPVEVAYDAGIMYAARAVLDNWAGDNDWTADLHEYADEIRGRVVPGRPALPSLQPLIDDTRAEVAEEIADACLARRDWYTAREGVRSGYRERAFGCEDGARIARAAARVEDGTHAAT